MPWPKVQDGVHFATLLLWAQKREIFECAVYFMLQEAYRYIELNLQRRQSQEGANFNPLKSYVSVMFRWLDDNPPYASFLCYFYYLLATRKTLGLSSQVFLKRAYMRIESALLESVGRGFYQKPSNIESVVQQVHGSYFRVVPYGRSLARQKSIRKI